MCFFCKVFNGPPIKNPKAIADAILKLYQNEGFRKKLGMGAKEQIKQKMNMENAVNSMKNIYEEFIEG